MKNIFFILLTLIISNAWSSSDSNKQLIKNSLYNQTVTFQEFHDPGWLQTTDGKTYDFHYKGFTYENINTWKKGRKLIYSYSHERGIFLYDPKSKTVAFVGASGKHPIELITEACLSKATSTTGIAGCYNDEFDNWSIEMKRILKILKETYNVADFNIIEAMNKSWLIYRDHRYAVGQMVHAHETGTVTLIESNARTVIPVREQVSFLLSLVKN